MKGNDYYDSRNVKVKGQGNISSSQNSICDSSELGQDAENKVGVGWEIGSS